MDLYLDRISMYFKYFLCIQYSYMVVVVHFFHSDEIHLHRINSSSDYQFPSCYGLATIRAELHLSVADFNFNNNNSKLW